MYLCCESRPVARFFRFWGAKDILGRNIFLTILNVLIKNVLDTTKIEGHKKYLAGHCP